MKHASILKRTTVIFILVTTIPMVLFAILNAFDTKKSIYAREERLLIQLAIKMSLALPGSYEDILKQENAQDLCLEEKTAILNHRLQPIIEKLAAEHPNNALVYGDKNRRLAAYPKALGLTSPLAQQTYETKTVNFFRNPASTVFGGEPVLALLYPLVRNGEVFGHAGAIIREKDIERRFYLIWGRNLGLFSFVWLATILIIRRIMVLLRSGHQQLADQIRNHNDDQAIILQFPEMESVFATVIELREKLSQQKNRMYDILNGISDGFFSVDREWQITFINQAAVASIKKQLNELLGKSAWEIFPGGKMHNDKFQQAMAERVKINFEAYSDIMQAWIEINVYPLDDGGLAVFFSDITQRKQTERELARMEVLNLVGQMAAGISHEVRNPLTTVRGYLQLFAAKASFSERERQTFSVMIEELDRANSIITEFLSVAKTNPGNLRVMDINDIILTLKPLLETAAIQGGHELCLLLNCPGCLVEVNEREIRQLLLNLVKNAIEAMETPGQVTIATESRKKNLILSVSDQGKGIPEEVLVNMGKPFFTTKSHGTGLGLSTCFAIARRHKGLIDIKSGPQGTTVSAIFPLVQG